MADDLPNPPYDIPLTDEELLLMGKIAVMWGQIDEAFNTLLRWVLRIDPEVFESLLGRQMIHARVKTLQSAVHTAKDPTNKKMIEELISQMFAVIPRRNAAMHGCWGRFALDPSFEHFEIGIFNHQKPKERFYSSQLQDLYRDLVSILDLAGNLLMRSAEENPAPIKHDRNRIYYAKQHPNEQAIGEFRTGDKVIPVA